MSAEQKDSMANSYQMNNNLPQRGGSFQSKLMPGGGMAMGRNATQLQPMGQSGAGNLEGHLSGGPEIENLIQKLSQSTINKGPVR